jgi:hypothetical protein
MLLRHKSAIALAALGADAGDSVPPLLAMSQH